MILFRMGEFKLHSGQESDFKIDCEALNDGDWYNLAWLIHKRLGPFRIAVGIPAGGIRLAEALQHFCTDDPRHPLVLVDDVYSTGASMCEAREQALHNVENVVGVVLFARNPVKESWIRAVFTMTLEDEPTVAVPVKMAEQFLKKKTSSSEPNLNKH